MKTETVQIPYNRHCISEDDIQAVVDVLRSDWITQGPRVSEFERAVSDFCNAKHGVAVSSGTAALHAAMFAADIKKGDEVIVSTMTFASTANSVVFQNGTPVFADVDSETLLIDPLDVERKITDRTKAIIAVDYAGQPCNYKELKKIAKAHNLILIADASHALGATYCGKRVGSIADMTIFSFHAIKHITTGEGGMVVTDNDVYQGRMRLFRNHGITTDLFQRALRGTWYYKMVDLGFNYRITDFQCALGLSQLNKLPDWIDRRRKIASRYDHSLENIEGVEPLRNEPDGINTYHLYVARFRKAILGKDRAEIFSSLRNEGIGVNVHYIPVHLHPFYQKKFGTARGLCPKAESLYEEILSLPIFVTLNESMQDTVVSKIRQVLK
jgi:UDP-4-amino-4,6-dideoxy-N-acetyl-beta-L-altrosamine transaminase